MSDPLDRLSKNADEIWYQMVKGAVIGVLVGIPMLIAFVLIINAVAG